MRLRTALAAMLLTVASGAQAGILTFYANLSPEAVGASGSGSAHFTFDDVTNVLAISASFSGLSGTTTAAHIHCCTALPLQGTAGVAVHTPSLAGFPLGVSAGVFAGSYDLDDLGNLNPAFIAGSGGTTDLAITRLLNAFQSGTAYLNIHTNRFPGGEIRGFVIPEPASAALALVALAAMGAVGARRKRSA